MSHIAQTETKIKKVNESIMQQTLELIAKAEPKLSIGTTYKDYSQNNVAADAALFTPDLPRGLGLKWRNSLNALVFEGDSFNHRPEYNRLQELVVSTYHTLVTKQALTELGLQVDISELGQNHNRIQAVYA